MGRKLKDDYVPDEGIHVGKRSMGWSFGFRAWREGYKVPEHLLDLGDGREIRIGTYVHEPSPFETLIESRQDWFQKVFRAPGFLVSEYGYVEDPMDICGKPGPDFEQIAKEQSPMYRGPMEYPGLYHAGPRSGQPREWRDPEGFRFYDGEFC